MLLRSGLMFGGVVPQVGGCWGAVLGGVEMSLSMHTDITDIRPNRGLYHGRLGNQCVFMAMMTQFAVISGNGALWACLRLINVLLIFMQITAQSIR